MRSTILAALAALLALAVPALAKNSPYPPVTQFNGDRYVGVTQLGPEVVRSVKRQRAGKHRRHHYDPVPVPRARPGTVSSPRLKYRRIAWQRQQTSLPMSAALERPPSPRPRAWCGWWLGRQLGMLSRSLWLARNWAHVGAPSGKHVGAIVVWRHHVGKITAVRADGAIRVLSGNDGRAVRDRWRSARGVIAYRAL